MKKTVILMLSIIVGTILHSASVYEYRRELREGARGKWVNLRKHLSSGEGLEKELIKVDRQIDKKVNEIQEIEELLFKIEKYKIENNIR